MVRAGGCDDPACTHEAGKVVGCVADRLDLLAVANPAYGRRITAERMVEPRLQAYAKDVKAYEWQTDAADAERAAAVVAALDKRERGA
jgi:hypothetical protein